MARKKKQNRVTVGGNVPRPGQTSPNTIILTQTQRFGIDMATYMAGIHNFENIDYSRRSKLYDLFSEIMMDPHVASVVTKRKSAVLCTPIVFRRNGVPDDVINEQLRSPWFYRFLSDAWDYKTWGNSLFQFYMNGKWIDYDLIPRKHVDPQRRLILQRQTDITGTSWDEYEDLLFVGDPNDPGIFAQAAPYVIYKRNTMADWAQFSEIFGMPVREYTYDGNDEDARSRILKDAFEDGGAAVIIRPEGSGFRFVESNNKSGSADLYDKLTERCNAEISKLFLGNTLTTEASATGTQALGTVQKKSEELINQMDRTDILNILNYDMTDTFASLGFSTEGGSFDYESEEVDIDKKLAMVEKLMGMGLPVSHDYLYETFGIEKPKDYNSRMKVKKEKEKEDVIIEKEKVKTANNFFNRFFD
ncbi:hypothetical protein M2138_001715 [Dysgonomonadaceae bacterium PH5-43]|nr:hypothetical protein [Dysgonomonadaceae bacterium PH5-43]